MQHIMCLTKEDITSSIVGLNFSITAIDGTVVNFTREAATKLFHDLKNWLDDLDLKEMGLPPINVSVNIVK